MGVSDVGTEEERSEQRRLAVLQHKDEEVELNHAYPLFINVIVHPAYQLLAKEYNGSIYTSQVIIRAITKESGKGILSIENISANTSMVLRIQAQSRRDMYVYMQRGHLFLYELNFLNQRMDKFYVEHGCFENETVEGLIETIENKISNMYPKNI